MRLDAWNAAAGEMNEATGKSAPLQETTSGSPSASESGMELGLNSWFPAYGFHAPQLQLQIHAAPGHYQPNFQPTHEDIRSNDAMLVQQVEFLETILEETSDDLQSDSDRSGTAYWLGSDSETESVIHVRARHAEEKFDGSGSECNSVVPKKRRRKNAVDEEEEEEDEDEYECDKEERRNGRDEDEDAVMMYGDNEEEEEEEEEEDEEDRDGDFSSSSRSSSLLQFETLERTCATNCRDSPSSYSFDSLDFASRRANGNFGNTSPDSLEGRSFDGDQTMLAAGNNSLPVKMRPYRSFESLESCQRLEDASIRAWNGGFSTFASLAVGRASRGRGDDLSDDYDDEEYDYDYGYEEPGGEPPPLSRRQPLARDRDFWHQDDSEDLAEFDKFEDRLGFEPATTAGGYATSMDCRNVIDLREIGIETKRDAVLDLRSGQATSSAAMLLHSRINIAGIGLGGGGSSSGVVVVGGGGQQGWSEQGFNFRFTDKSQSVPSLGSDVSTHGAATRRCSISPSQLHFEAQDFETFVQVCSVPVGLHLCGLTADNAPRSASDEKIFTRKNDTNFTEHQMADLNDSRDATPSPEQPESNRPVTSTVRTQDRRPEASVVLIPVTMDQDAERVVDSIVDEAIRQLKQRDLDDGDADSDGQRLRQQRSWKVKNNASYELAQQNAVGDRRPRLLPRSKAASAAEGPKPTPRCRVKNNASYELAQQFDYVQELTGQRPFHRMDACDEEIEEPGPSRVRVRDLVDEMNGAHATGSTSELASNRFAPPEARVYSKSSEELSESRAPPREPRIRQRPATTIVDEQFDAGSVFSEIKKNLDSFSTCGESASGAGTTALDSPNPDTSPAVDKEPLVDHHQHHQHYHQRNTCDKSTGENGRQETDSPSDDGHGSGSPTTDREEDQEENYEEEEDEEKKEVKEKETVEGKPRLRLDVGAATSAGFFAGKQGLDPSSARSVSSTPNLHKISYIGEFYPVEGKSEQDVGACGADDDAFSDDVDEGIGSVKDYDRFFLHGSVRSESAIGARISGRPSARPEVDRQSNGRNAERRSRADSSTTSGNTSLGEGSTASEWPQRTEPDDVYPPLSATAEPLQRIASLKRSGTVEAKQTQSTESGVPRNMSTMQHQQQDNGTGKVHQEKKKGLGGFLQRFSRLRFSGRSKVPRSELLKKSDARPNNVKVINKPVQDHKRSTEPDYVIIPLHGPIDEPNRDQQHLAVVESPSQNIGGGKTTDVQRSGSNLSSNSRSAISSKPPLPPQPPRAGALGARPPSGVGARRRAATDLGSPTAIEMAKARAMQAGSERPVGLLETDLDAAEVADASVDHQVGVATPATANNKKTRSLLNLNHSRPVPDGRSVLNAPQSPGGTDVEGAQACGHQRPHKSMEFLLDKENLHFVKPPENELQKVGERVPSEHELRVQRSLQRLNVPDWYKNSPAARDGFRLKRHSDASQHCGWRTLGSKTTSLSSLSSSNKQPPAGPLLSPSPTPPVFSRWSTSLLNSAGSSPASSARSSFNHRQPYLGWRSQERLSNPRTPAERLAQGILPNVVPPTSKKQTTSFGPAQQLEVRNSIKEVTSAIVHYVQSGQEVNGSGRLSPRPNDWDDRGGARSTSPRGSVKLCWMESSFVGIRPVDSPKTPMSLTTDMECCAVCNSTPSEPCTCVDSATSGLFLDLTPDDGQRMSPSRSSNYHHRHHRGSGSGNSDTEEAMAAAALLRNKPSPGSTTLEDVLDSLLGLPPASRTPSPGPGPTRRSTAAGKSCSTLRQDLQESASTMLEASLEPGETGPPSYYAQGAGQVRRKSEGSDSLPPRNAGKYSGLRNRRVSFDNAQDSPGGLLQQHQHHHHQQQYQQERIMVRCRYSKCTNSATASEARRSYKTCHNCSYAYCSRECRRAHWERHRRTCLHSRAGTLCRQVLSSAKKDGHSLQHVSTLARRGYASHGRGAVKCFFTSPESAEKFISNGFIDLGEPTYVRWSDLLPSEMGTELHAELMRLCKSYNPETRLVLYVAVCVVSEVPTSGAVRWERQLVSRCAKIRLASSCREPAVPAAPTIGNSQLHQQTQRQTSPCNITREMDSPETLVLTSFPGMNGQNTPQRAREISFTNIQRQLRLRGVSLRRHFPQVYKKLCSYVDGSVDKFAPVTIYPRDQASGKSFMCIIMLDAEPERLQLLPTDSSRVRTVDISIEQE